VGPDPGEQQDEEGYRRERRWQQQAETAPGTLLRGFNWPKGWFGRGWRRRLLLRLFGAPECIVD
jgi:hypothetical protein